MREYAIGNALITALFLIGGVVGVLFDAPGVEVAGCFVAGCWFAYVSWAFWNAQCSLAAFLVVPPVITAVLLGLAMIVLGAGEQVSILSGSLLVLIALVVFEVVGAIVALRAGQVAPRGFHGTHGSQGMNGPQAAFSEHGEALTESSDSAAATDGDKHVLR